MLSWLEGLPVISKALSLIPRTAKPSHGGFIPALRREVAVIGSEV